MQTCTRCGHKNPAEIRLCLNCAARIGSVCPACGEELTAGFKFCGHCGTHIEPEQAAVEPKKGPETLFSKNEQILKILQAQMPEDLSEKIAAANLELVGQRRGVTVMFVRIADYEDMSRVLGDEETYTLVDRLMRLMVDIIYRFEGTIDKFTGRGLMAIFGLPVNHENDPERAVHAALEFQTAIQPIQESLKREQNIELNTRIGINTGHVIAGKLGSEFHMEYTVIGDMINLASRLEKTAKPSQILISFQTYQRVRPIFQFENLRRMQLEGQEQPIRAFRPIRASRRPGQVRGLPGLRAPMIGRQEPLHTLKDGLQQVLDSESGQCIFVSGDAGIGKSRLIAEFKRGLVGPQVRVYQGTSQSHIRIVPYRVMADIIRAIIEVSDLDSEELQREMLNQHLANLSLDEQDVFPYLLHVMGLRQADPMLQTRISLLDPAMLQRQIHTALRSLFIAEAELSPVILIFEDLHWSDSASQQFLDNFSRSLVDLPILLVLISRDFESEQDRENSTAVYPAGEESVHIRLHPLSGTHARHLLDQLLVEDSPQMEDLKRVITKRAFGNPYFLEELVRALIEEEGLIREEDRWIATAKASDILEEVPGTLQDIIIARFDRLPGDLRAVLQKAAVLGESGVIQLLQVLLPHLEPKSLLAAVRGLESRDFLHLQEIDLHLIFSFRHPLIQETFYKSILARDLQKLHEEVAQAIELGHYWLPDEKNAILAFHLSHGKNPAAAVPHLIAAADQASRQFANESAAVHYRQAILLMGNIPTNAHDRERFASARIGLGKALKLLGNFIEGVQVLEEAAEFLQDFEIQSADKDDSILFLRIAGLRELADIRSREGALDTAAQLLQDGLDLMGSSGYEQSPTEWRRQIDRLAWVIFQSGQLEEAFKLADLALMNVSLRETDDPITLASLNNTLGGIYWQWARQKEAISHVENSLEIYHNLNYHWGKAVAYTNLGILHYGKGEWRIAVERFEQADAIRKEHGYHPERATNLKNLGELLIYLGDHEGARIKLEESRAIGLQVGMGLSAAYAEIGLCRLAIVEGRFQVASSHLRVAKNLVPGAQKDDSNVQLIFLEAMILAEDDRMEEAIELAQEAVSLANEGGFLEEKKESLRVLGSLYIRRDEFDAAELHLEQALKLAREGTDHYRQAQVLVELARSALGRARSEPKQAEALGIRARTSLDEASLIFDRLGARFDLASSQLLLVGLPELAETAENRERAEAELEPSGATDTKLLQGERYHAAILQVLLRRSEGVDDDLAFDALSVLLPALLEVAVDGEGHVIREKDGIKIVFGAPTAHEDDRERAVDTAMQMANLFRDLETQAALPFSIHLAVADGLVIAGAVPAGDKTRFLVTGRTVQEAESLAQAASPSKIWVTKSVRIATSHRFDYSKIQREVKSLPVDAEATQLEGLRDQILPVRGLIGIRTPLVGRQHEISTMSLLGGNLQRQSGGIIWIEGEPGIGKSRLMREFAALMKVTRPWVWEGNCQKRRSDRAFSLFTDLLMNMFELQPTMPMARMTELIDEKLGEWAVDLEATRPYLLLLLGIQQTDIGGANLAGLEPEQIQRQIFVAIRRLVEHVARERPIILLLDDVQWVDSISADLVFFLSSLILTSPVLLVLSQRTLNDNISRDVLVQMRKLHNEKTIELEIQPFSLSECESFLKALVPDAESSENLKHLIIQQSGGNPFYIEEFLRMMVEQGYLRVQKGMLVFNQPFEIDSLTIPPSLELLIRARVDVLPASAKKLLQLASVVGQQFHLDLLLKISQEANIVDLLKMMSSRGMVLQVASTSVWQFSHPMIENTVYFTLLKANRRTLHYRIADTLKREFVDPETDYVEELAYHYDLAGEAAEALPYIIRAGEQAAARYANEEALLHFTRAMEIFEGLPEPNYENRWRVAAGLGEIYSFIGNYEASLIALESEMEQTAGQTVLSSVQKAGLFRRMGEAMQKKGDQDAAIMNLNEGLAILDSSGERPDKKHEMARLLTRLGWSFSHRGELEQAQQAALAALRAAVHGGGNNVIAMAENLLGGICYRQGELEQAIEHTQRAKDTWEVMGYSWGVAAAVGNIGILEVANGNLDAAALSFQRSLTLRQQMGDVEGIAITNNNLGRLACDRGQLSMARGYFQDSLAVAKPFQMAWQIANSTVGLAQTLLYQGELVDAEHALQEGLRIGLKIDARETVIELHIVQAQIALEHHNYKEATEIVIQAAKAAAEVGNVIVESSAWRLAADCLLRQGQPQPAYDMLDRAWQVLARGGEELETGRVHALAAQIDRARAHSGAADEHFQIAEKIFSELGASRDMEILQVSV
jgi:predicted ATPase/class 3 adenylate cyclase